MVTHLSVFKQGYFLQAVAMSRPLRIFREFFDKLKTNQTVPTPHSITLHPAQLLHVFICWVYSFHANIAVFKLGDGTNVAEIINNEEAT